MQGVKETWIQSLGGEDPLEKEMATTPVCLPGDSQGQRSPVGYSPWGHKGLDTTEHGTPKALAFSQRVKVNVKTVFEN